MTAVVPPKVGVSNRDIVAGQLKLSLADVLRPRLQRSSSASEVAGSGIKRRASAPTPPNMLTPLSSSSPPLPPQPRSVTPTSASTARPTSRLSTSQSPAPPGVSRSGSPLLSGSDRSWLTQSARNSPTLSSSIPLAVSTAGGSIVPLPPSFLERSMSERHYNRDSPRASPRAARTPRGNDSQPSLPPSPCLTPRTDNETRLRRQSTGGNALNKRPLLVRRIRDPFDIGTAHDIFFIPAGKMTMAENTILAIAQRLPEEGVQSMSNAKFTFNLLQIRTRATLLLVGRRELSPYQRSVIDVMPEEGKFIDCKKPCNFVPTEKEFDEITIIAPFEANVLE